jgi:hypothetical protein
VDDETFYATWDPRIGHEAAVLLHKRARWFPVLFIDFIAIVVLGQFFNGSAYYLWAGLVAVVLFAEVGYMSARTNRRIAAAMSRHLGFHVGGLPSFRTTTRYDDWLADQRGTAPYSEKKIFGNFVRLRLPPKH